MRPEELSNEAGKLWNRIGLQKLRDTLDRVGRLGRDFEETLKSLPACDDCAHLRLLEGIERAGVRLSKEAMSLTALTATLKEAAAIADRERGELAKKGIAPCRCSSGPCRCHHG